MSCLQLSSAISDLFLTAFVNQLSKCHIYPSFLLFFFSSSSSSSSSFPFTVSPLSRRVLFALARKYPFPSSYKSYSEPWKEKQNKPNVSLFGFAALAALFSFFFFFLGGPFFFSLFLDLFRSDFDSWKAPNQFSHLLCYPFPSSYKSYSEPWKEKQNKPNVSLFGFAALAALFSFFFFFLGGPFFFSLFLDLFRSDFDSWKAPNQFSHLLCVSTDCSPVSTLSLSLSLSLSLVWRWAFLFFFSFPPSSFSTCYCFKLSSPVIENYGPFLPPVLFSLDVWYLVVVFGRVGEEEGKQREGEVREIEKGYFTTFMDWDSKMPTWDLPELEQHVAEANLSSVVDPSSGGSGSGRRHGDLDCSIDLKLGGFRDFGLPEKWKEQRPASTAVVVPSMAAATGPSKRPRGPSNSGQNVSCLVDDCKSDLSGCRDYHRRHKVCEVHAKTPVVIVGGQEQRFCQQCSRFHLLLEFDEVKRSCRKRLDGHNRRRRKPQPESLMNSGNLFPSMHGSMLTFYPQNLLATTNNVKAEEGTIFSHPLASMHFTDRLPPPPHFASTFIRSLKNGEAEMAVGGGASCQPLVDSISSAAESSSSKIVFSDSSDCALSLLSSPTRTSGINLGHMVPADGIPMGQPLLSSLHYGEGLGRFSSCARPDSRVVSATGFSCSGVDDENLGTVLVPDGGEGSLHCQSMFHVGEEAASDEVSQSIPFSCAAAGGVVRPRKADGGGAAAGSGGEREGKGIMESSFGFNSKRSRWNHGDEFSGFRLLIEHETISSSRVIPSRRLLPLSTISLLVLFSSISKIRVPKMKGDEIQSGVLHELGSFVLSTLRFPLATIHSAGSDEFAPAPRLPLPRALAATGRLPPLSPAGLVSLLLGISLTLMLCGSVTFVIGFMMMPWVMAMVMFLYFCGIISSVSSLWKALIGLASSLDLLRTCPRENTAEVMWSIYIIAFANVDVDVIYIRGLDLEIQLYGRRKSLYGLLYLGLLVRPSSVYANVNRGVTSLLIPWSHSFPCARQPTSLASSCVRVRPHLPLD
ncbi:Squamosa promoter-binding-like protein 16 [Apostasia shenzhenica]|uniref:Squamosa promoter-binding-like protein 16 n=1 Tax=Apostasia shenzhenica TaxID=1088818 RepID=A0A2I0B0P6_9ASPA|nr:Squamosa promoter-binding-like protein 16 [Apostasia shenzhenica]